MRDEVVAAAGRRIQEVGVGGCSYGDLARELGIRAPSIHHHFPTKEDLLTEVARRYRLAFAERVADVEPVPVVEALVAYAALFEETSSAELLCLCGAVAAEWHTVGAGPRREVEAFFDEQAAWLTDRLQAGVTGGELRPDLDVPAAMTLLLAALEGSTLLSRAGDRGRVPTIVADAFTALTRR